MLLRSIAGVAGFALAAALARAVAAGLDAAAAEGWWDAGLRRLALLAIVDRFDRAALVALGVAVVLGGAAWALGAARSRVLRAGRLLLAAVAALRVLALADVAARAGGPNVVLVSIDTLRADRLGAYGHTLSTSPAVDRLAGEGVVFENAFSQSPKTTPSHMTMLTSLYPTAHGIQLWETNTPGAVLNPAVTTLAEALKNAGWATGAFTGGGNVDRARGFQQGFDVYRQSKQLDRALRFMRRHRFRKFFLFFHTFAVHDPYLPPDGLIARFAPGAKPAILETVRRLRADARGWEHAHERFWAGIDPRAPEDVETMSRLYDAGIRHMDDTILTPLLAELAALGVADDTLLVFTSDHGEAFAEHGRFLHEDLYVETLHVPLVLRFPGRLPGGVRVAAPVRLLDLMPTVLELVGVLGPAAMQGTSLAPLVSPAGPAPTAARGPEDVVSEHNNASTGRILESLRRGPFTYILEGTTERLFDRDGDPGERADVAATAPDTVAAMRSRLGAWREATRSLASAFRPLSTATPDAETLRRLRALGYVE
jgi:arylsulfatase A-like enzyme